MGEINVVILKRYPGQSFWIGKEVQIVVLGHFNGVTHIGIEAPPEVRVVRDEDKEYGHKND